MDRRTFLASAACLTIATRSAYGDEPARMRDIYNKDMSFSDYARSMEGESFSVTGFMAPPLKAQSAFFVLTKRPMSVCPFCESEADWPNDILAVYTARVVNALPFNIGIIAKGTLALGTYEDPELGFVSRVRLIDASYKRL